MMQNILDFIISLPAHKQITHIKFDWVFSCDVVLYALSVDLKGEPLKTWRPFGKTPGLSIRRPVGTKMLEARTVSTLVYLVYRYLNPQVLY